MDMNYMQLLAAAAAAPSYPFTSTSASNGGQQSFSLNPPALLHNPWLQQQFFQQRLAFQQYLENIHAVAAISPTSVVGSTASSTPVAAFAKADGNAVNSSIDGVRFTVVHADNSTTSYLSDVEGSDLVAPIAKRPRLVLPTINVEDQKNRLEKQAHATVASPHSVQAEIPSWSAQVVHSTFSPSLAQSSTPVTEIPQDIRCSPSTSADTLNQKEDEEPELYIDIESVDNRPEGRDRRKAYIDFYRKVKSARQRERGPMLNCALCDDQVLSNDNAIHTHVNQHADAGGFWCKLCGLNEPDKSRIYEHMRLNHPNNMELFEDRRDIVKLCAVIQECFPRVCARIKKESGKELDTIVKCKSCKFTSEDMKTQEEHQVSVHTSLEPKLTVEFNICSASDVITRTVQSCFAHVLQFNNSDEQQKNPTTNTE
ncbi:unnamed protein product [Nippostrongylus brasiliensis]|uniref:C2H2-type domain-containing protein n=1 Tax=Nippostrongylus brasiliensis TaxID=27835 RepID=A0A0N4YG20_NIPBR|nr:unnamed protein product [Nippostrongylus brasiliensis]